MTKLVFSFLMIVIVSIAAFAQSETKWISKTAIWKYLEDGYLANHGRNLVCRQVLCLPDLALIG